MGTTEKEVFLTYLEFSENKKGKVFMKIKDGFILKNVAGNYIIVPVGGELVDLGAMITANETGAFLWEKMKEDVSKDELVDALMKEYDVEESIAREDIDAFLDILKKNNMLSFND